MPFHTSSTAIGLIPSALGNEKESSFSTRLTDFMASPLMQMLMTFIGGQDLQRQQGEAKDANQERLDRILGGSQSLQNSLVASSTRRTATDAAGMEGLLERLMGELQGRFSGTRDRFAEGSQSILDDQRASNVGITGNLEGLSRSLAKQFEDRTATGMGFLEDADIQGREDIGDRFDASGRTAQANLVARGLAGSTIAPNIQQGVERQRGQELRRFDEGIRREKLDAFTGLTGDALRSQERLGVTRADFDRALQEAFSGRRSTLLTGLTNLEQDQTGALTGLDLGLSERILQILSQGSQRTSDIVERLGMHRFGVLENVSNPFPNTNAWLQFARQFGQNSATQPQQPSTFNQMLPGLIQGGSSILGATIIAGGICIGEDSVIDGENPKTLRDVRIGDMVLSADGNLQAVVAKHFVDNRFDDDRWDATFIRLHKDKRDILVSVDHVIDGKPAGEWAESDQAWSDKAERMFVGDILLEDGSDYMANGFAVQSLIAHSDIPALRVIEPANMIGA